MFTKWQQVEDWIRDNRFNRWIFYKSNPDSKGEGDRSNDKIVDNKFYNGDPQDEKLRLTRKYLEQWGGRAYGVAFQGETATTGGAQCVVALEEAAPAAPVQVAGTAGIGSADIEQIKAQVREQVRTEFEKQAYERERKDFEQERKQFERDKNSAVGLMIGYLKPVINALNQKRVAGVDADEDVQAARIKPIDEPTPAEPAQDTEDFTDDEVDRLNALVARFKAVEPCYLDLLEKVVTLAENGDSTYIMAKEMLLK